MPASALLRQTFPCQTFPPALWCMLWQDDLRPLLHLDATREAETNAFIVDRMKAALDINKA